MKILKSDWIDFLRQYGPIAHNDNMYDEVIHETLKKKKLQPITFETPYLQELIDNFKSDKPKSIILTGTAGDGKSFRCRAIWEKLGGDKNAWNQGDKIHTLNIEQKKLIIIKDLSEINSDEQISLLISMSESIFQESSSDIYLIAANDGQLIEAFTKIKQNDSGLKVGQIIEELLVTDSKEKDGYSLSLYNLSRLENAKLFQDILEAILNHPGWQTCHQCVYCNPEDIHQRCPIWENKQRLEDTNTGLLKQRLIDLLELAELNERHLPIRQLLLLVANILLGHPDGEDGLMNCKQIPSILSSAKTSLASPYRNAFGENLSERKRYKTDVFAILRSFGIGIQTSDRIDNILIFGVDDPTLNQDYQDLIGFDAYYGSDSKFCAAQKAYLEGDESEDKNLFLSLLQSHRQRLFFTIPPEKALEMKLWNLTNFKYAGEYLEEVYRVRKQGERVTPKIVARLAKGLNRVFTGWLIQNQDELILATAGSYSQARISRIFEDTISVIKDRGESVTLEFNHYTNKLDLVVSIHPQISSIRMRLNLTRYEYLNQVAEGALPSNFSQECYEDILAFKSQILSQLTKRRELEKDSNAEESINFKLLQVNAEGKASGKLLEIES